MSEQTAYVDIVVSDDYVTCEVRIVVPPRHERCGECGADHEVTHEQSVTYEMTPWSAPGVHDAEKERVAKAVCDARAALDRFAAQLVKEADGE